VPLTPMPPDDQALRSPGLGADPGTGCHDVHRPHLPKACRVFSVVGAPTYYLPSTVILMRATPLPVIPITPAAAAVRSMMRPAM
jgi:hypothetical protein